MKGRGSDQMPVWFFVVLLLVLFFAVGLAVAILLVGGPQAIRTT